MVNSRDAWEEMVKDEPPMEKEFKTTCECECGHNKYSHKYNWGGTCMNESSSGYFLCKCLSFKAKK